MIPAPLVSVCMPVSRDREWFRTALHSVLSQTMTDIEVIIADDGAGGLKTYVESTSDSRIRYIHNLSSLGFSRNHCKAIEEANGTYIAFLHDDDIWKNTFLADTVAIIEADAQLGFVIAGATEIDQHDQLLGRRPARIPNGSIADPVSVFLRRDFMVMLPSLTLFRREALEANIRPWPDVIAADLTMYLDIVIAGWGAYYLDEPLVFYRTHDTQIGTNNVAHRHALVTVWSRYSFDKAPHETQRRERLAEAYLARAGAYLRGQPSRENAGMARGDLRKAQQLGVKGSRRLKLMALYACTFFPKLVPVAISAWGKMHDPIGHRHKG